MTTEQKIYDLGFLEELEDQHFIAEVITLYLRDTNDGLQEMTYALSAGTMETVYSMAHKLKSSTGMLQANALFIILEQVEAISIAGEKSDRLSGLVQMATHEFERLRIALEAYPDLLVVA